MSRTHERRGPVDLRSPAPEDIDLRNPGAPDGPAGVVIVGAGPAGLTAAWQLAKAGHRSTVLEADRVVGGISRTVERDGWRFDIGGHRFFTKVPSVESLWHEILPQEDFLTRPRLSRIYYQGRFFDYPLRAGNALRNLGVVEASRCVGSYLWARVRPPKDQSHLEGWVSARFGARLYRMFFKTYTEKVWGVDATEIQADWAAQRIRNLSLGTAVLRALLPRRNQKTVASLIEEFQYPRLGPGMMWERAAELVTGSGSEVVFDSPVVRIRHEGGRAVAVVARSGAGAGAGKLVEYRPSHVISSMPLPALLLAMDPPVPPEVAAAAEGLAFRDFLTVALVVPAEDGFPDNWIYVHSPEVRVGRIQNFGSWSPHLVKDGRTCLGLEYFVFQGDDLWTAADEDLVELGKAELARLGLVDPTRVETGYVVRMPKAYPMYDETYQANVAVLRAWLERHAANVFPVGRNGMHKYNNQDHSMLTAMLAVENILGADHDIWSVNVEAEYHEESASGSNGSGSGGTGRSAPILPVRAHQSEPAAVDLSAQSGLERTGTP